MYCFANIGVPKNPDNPYYAMTDPVTNPTGYNPLGTNYIDYGLGSNAVGGLDGTKFFNNDPGRHPPVQRALPDPDGPQRRPAAVPRRSSRRTSTTAGPRASSRSSTSTTPGTSP